MQANRGNGAMAECNESIEESIEGIHQECAKGLLLESINSDDGDRKSVV